MNQLKTIKCTRCNGAGGFDGFLHVEGGTCFSCNGKGFKYVDKFIEKFGPKPAQFYGLTYGARQQYKEITCDAGLIKNLMAGVTAVEITEEQARRFFAKYGTKVELRA